MPTRIREKCKDLEIIQHQKKINAKRLIVFNPCFDLFFLVLVRVPVPKDLAGNDAIKCRCTKVGEEKNPITSFLYRREDARYGAEEQHEARNS
jgi:hypothetical protein